MNNKRGSYQDQAKQIEKLAKSIIAKSNKFAQLNENESPWYDDLLHIIGELEEVDKFLK